jgi:hypothetical protein
MRVYSDMEIRDIEQSAANKENKLCDKYYREKKERALIWLVKYVAPAFFVISLFAPGMSAYWTLCNIWIGMLVGLMLDMYA